MTAQDISSSPTVSMAATRAGIILGTAAYMSPEQAKGKSVDRRADIWSFGVVLYEMLTGRQLYKGETASEIMAAVIMQEPDLDAVPSALPPRVRQLLRRCLTRDPTERLQAIGEAGIVLKNPGGHTEAANTDTTSASPPGLANGKRWAVVGAGAIALALLSAALAWRVKPPDAMPFRKFDIRFDQSSAGRPMPPQISPDGSKILYASENALWVRDLASLESRKLVDGTRARNFFWSPTGELAGYAADGKLWKVSVAGGQPQVITVLSVVLGQGAAFSWGPDGQIVLAQAMPATGMLQVSAQGGDLKTLLSPKDGTEQDFHDPHWLPGQRRLLYVIDRGQRVTDTLAVLADGKPKEILRIKGEEFRSPVYSPSGHILFHRVTTNPGIWALPFSLGTLEATGEPFLVAGNGAMPSVSHDGTLTYVREVGLGPRKLTWTDMTGKEVGSVGDALPGLTHPRLSPDGARIAAVVGNNIWVFDVARNTRARLTFDEKAESTNPAWSPDGKQVIYNAFSSESNTNAVFVQPADGSGTAKNLFDGNSASMSPNGKFLAYVFRSPKTASDVWILPLQEGGKPFLAVETLGSDTNPQISPNGRFLMYQTNESGIAEVFIKPFPSGEGKWQVSTRGGMLARWSPSGNKLVFLDFEGRLVEVDVAFQPSFALGSPRPFFTASPSLISSDGFDFSRDGRRLLMLQNPSASAEQIGLILVQNWFEEFRDKQKK